MDPLDVHDLNVRVRHSATMPAQMLISCILDAAVASAEAFEDIPAAILWPEEAAALGNAIQARRREFATTRALARDALSALGIPMVPILPGKHREPVWPSGVVGSITHCLGYRAAVAALSTQVRALGIDAEPDAPLPSEVIDAVARDEEQRWMSAQADDIAWDRLLFSAKEAIFKAWFPLTHYWLGFHDVKVTILRDERRFTAQLTADQPRRYGELTSFEGRFLLARRLIVTSVCCR